MKRIIAVLTLAAIALAQAGCGIAYCNNIDMYCPPPDGPCDLCRISKLQEVRVHCIGAGERTTTEINELIALCGGVPPYPRPQEAPPAYIPPCYTISNVGHLRDAMRYDGACRD